MSRCGRPSKSTYSVLAGERSYFSDCFLASEGGTVWFFSAPTVLILEVNFRRGVEVEVRKPPPRRRSGPSREDRKQRLDL